MYRYLRNQGWNVGADQFQTTQELQIRSGDGGGILSWMASVYYYKNHRNNIVDYTAAHSLIGEDRTSALGNPIDGWYEYYGTDPGHSGSWKRDSHWIYWADHEWTERESKAIFGQIDLALSKKFNIAIGIRYTMDDKKVDRDLYGYWEDSLTNQWIPYYYDMTLDELAAAYYPNGHPITGEPVTGADIDERPLGDDRYLLGWPWFGSFGGGTIEDDWAGVTGSITLDYAPTPGSLIYLTVSRGYKAGAISAGRTADTETLMNYEVGYKTQMLDDRLRTNIAAFFYKYDDMQVQIYENRAGYFENAASARNFGIELEATALITERLTASIGWGYMNAEYEDYLTEDNEFPDLGIQDLSGNQIIQTPEHKINLSFSYTVPTNIGDFTMWGGYSFMDEQHNRPYGNPRDLAPSYERIDARLTWQDPTHQWEFAVWGKNLVNEPAYQDIDAFGAGYGWARGGIIGQPRLFGVTIRYLF